MLIDGWNGMDEHEGFEEQLRGLAPSTHRVDRDLLMFRAGQAAEQRHTGGVAARAWPVVSLVSSLAAIALGATLLLERAASRPMLDLAAQGETETIRSSDAPAPYAVSTTRTAPRVVLSRAQRPDPAPWAQYTALRDEVLAEGIEILPQPVSAPLARADAVLSPRSWLPERFPGGALNGIYRSRPVDEHAEGGLL